MLTKQEVEEIVLYCQENGTSFKERLIELSIPAWKFYDAKKKYCSGDSSKGHFLQLQPSDAGELSKFCGASAPKTRPLHRSSRKVNEVSPVNIEMKTATGILLRIQGEFTSKTLQDIILASSGYVQS